MPLQTMPSQNVVAPGEECTFYDMDTDRCVCRSDLSILYLAPSCVGLEPSTPIFCMALFAGLKWTLTKLP